ncbi:hypothetical protein GCM10007886_03450 [Methylobacterium gregans]|uniref:Uncharacterized protein n=1 Tax=Methylobacterium gregans TaxID=374424 RepID=A0AA37HR09_9HYPH|nr:hypothetical protein [Methylobacterium gregans]MDQ0520578.1 sRNA-binding protein [Methylobacterium gregans]GJD80075.1 hypothetical protein NBEOAGPD_3310 [Methylobacterium gregans]GLS52163.1 hypothetical protein GCM10007886_03450 [Methylobacterium gregans]
MVTPSGRRTRITLDGQLVGYWEREAARLDALAAEARFGWQRRRYLRKAAQARVQAERSRARERARGNEPAETAAQDPASAHVARDDS